MFEYINCPWLEPEILDVLRMFGVEDEIFGYHFEYSGGYYYNSIEYRGEFYDSRDYIFTADEVEFKRYAKRFAKLAFYKLLSEKLNISFPYGALTGIRPTKLAYMEGEAGRDFKETFKNFCVDEENISHVEEIIEVQKPFYADKGGQDMFISLPFCPTKCDYCSFITAPITKTQCYVDGYIDCLVKEILSVKPILKRVKSIYIGGGTPFCITEEQLSKVYAAVTALGLPPVEYTVEAGRPDTFTEEKLKLTKAAGVTRICINPQTFNDDTLKRIGRKHTAAQVYRAFEMSKSYGFDVNVDLIAGLEGETAKDMENSLSQAISLNPANITVHTLSLKAGAALKERCSRLKVEGIGEAIKLSRKMLRRAGYRPYYMYRQKYQAGGWENCGWAKPGKECVYNIDVMEEIADNIAVGANAISKCVLDGGARIERADSPKNIPTYIQKVDGVIAKRNKLFESD